MFDAFEGSINVIVDGTKVPSSSVSLLVIVEIVTGLSSSAEPESVTAIGSSFTALIIIFVAPTTGAATPSETV